MKRIIILFCVLLFFGFADAQILNETFDGSIPDTWTTIDNDNTPPEPFCPATTAIDGRTDIACFNGCYDDYLVTPALKPDASNNQLNYKAAGQYSFYSIDYQVLVSTTGTNAGDFTDLIQEQTSYNVTTWTAGEQTLDLSAYNGQKIYIAFYTDSGYDNWGIDDVNGIPLWQPADDAGITTLVNPANETTVGEHNVELRLKNFGSNQLSTVNIEWKLNGNQQTTYNWSGALTSGSTEDVIIETDFYFDGYYNLVVNTSNPNGNIDQETSNDTLKTDIIAIPDNYIIEGFENGFPPEDWQVQNIQGFDWQISNLNSYSGDYCVKMGEEQDCESRLITKLSIIEQNEFLKFYAKKETNSYNDSIFVEYSSNGTDFTTVAGFSLTENYEKYVADLRDVPAGDYFIGIRGKTDNFGKIYLDEILLPPYWIPQNDAGISQINHPQDDIFAGMNYVSVVLKNYGSNELTSADIEWSVGDIQQYTYNWTGTLSTGDSAVIELDDYNFHWQSKAYSILANTTNPNAQTDPNNDNDTSFVEFYAYINDQIYLTFEENLFYQNWETQVSGDWNWQITEVNSFQGDSSIYYYNDMPFSEQKLVSRLVTINSDDYLNFYGFTSWPENNPSLKIMYSEDKDNWTEVPGSEYVLTDVWTKYEIPLSDEITGDYYLAISASCSNQAAVYVDYVVGPKYQGVNIKDLADNDFVIYPNPASNFIIIKNNSSKNFNLKIFDLTGRIILTKDVSNYTEKIDLSEFTKGVYIIRISSNNKIYNSKFIKN